MRNGDLFHRQGSYAKVQGPAKVVQDFRVWLLTHLGEDELHEWFGSTLDGGTWPDGTVDDGVINTGDWDSAAMHIESEIRRITHEYQERQLARIEDDVQTYGRSTLRQDEILDGISDLQFYAVQDTLVVRIGLAIRSGISEVIDVPLMTG